MSVATASAVLRSRLTRTISRALPRLTAAIAQALPTLPVPTIPIFLEFSIAKLSTRRRSVRFERVCGELDPAEKRPTRRQVLAVLVLVRARARSDDGSLPRDAGRLEQEPGAPL